MNKKNASKMNPSDMYHQHGIREQVCTRAEYGLMTIVRLIKSKYGMFYCTHCWSKNVIRKGVVSWDFLSVPVGGKTVLPRMDGKRLEGKDCGLV